MHDAYVPGGTPSLPANGQVCTLFAVDIAGFTGPQRDDDICLYLHEELYRMLEKSFQGSGISWADCSHEDRGDGVLVVVPSDIACTAIIDPLPEQLRSLIRRHNHVSCEAAAIQLRAAVNIGPVVHDGHGFISSHINHLFRMLEARSLKHALASTGAELGLIISDHVYRNVVCRYPSRVGPDAFESIRFQVKRTRAPAWTYLPGHTGHEVALG
jgi:class 3 adenylate cyclase